MDRSTFLYLEPKVKTHNFAQCETCSMYLSKHNICSLHGKDVKIKPTMSCGLYVPNGPAPESEMEHVSLKVTPKESGLVDAKVRCEHCEYYEMKDNDCLLFKMLNIKEYKVVDDGCCNAWTKGDEGKKETKQEILKKFVK